MEAEPKPKPTHKPNGQFAKGNRLGKGPAKAYHNQVRAELRKAITVEDIVDIYRKQVDAAKEGNLDAAKFVAERMIGKPVPTNDDGEATGEIQIKVVHVEAPDPKLIESD